LFNPQSFLTAIKQVGKKAELNKLYILTEFQKTAIEDIKGEAKDGAYCYGFLLEGARWDVQQGLIEEARPLEMFSIMPVCLCKSEKMKDTKKENSGVYECPTYRTEMRGNTYIFTAQLRTSVKNPPRKWILAGVAMILDVEGISDEVKSTQKAA
jgi:dynein heavy chain, axonemal